jgi:5-methylcytosine-specific restriction endonuclease McrBC regulatory subunit McrC
MMITDITLVEGGPAQIFRGSDRDLHELKMRSVELVSRLGLPEEPFIVDEEAHTVAVRHVAGYIPLGDSTIEIMPAVLRHDPGWRLSMLTMLSTIHRLEWVPIADRATRHANLPGLMGLIVAEAMGRAVGEGVPRNYVEGSGRLASIRGQIDASKAWQRVIDPYTVDCRYSDFVANHPVASALKWACGELSGAVQEEWLQAELLNYTDLFPDASRELPMQSVLDSMQLSPQFGFLHDALDVARLLAMGPQGGNSARPGAPGRAFLWKTDVMFTEFVNAVIETAAKVAGGSSYREQKPLASVRSTRVREQAFADIVVQVGDEVVAIMVSADEYSETVFDEMAETVVAAGKRLGSSDVAIVFPASMALRPGSQWKLNDASGPRMLHAVVLDPSGVGEVGGVERILGEIEMDLGAVVSVSRRRASSLSSNRFAI